MTDEIYARAAEAIFHPSTKETVARIKHDLTRAGLAIVDAGMLGAATQWWPIETAPKDGTAILVHIKNNIFDVVCYSPKHPRFVWKPQNGDAWSSTIVTHWMPLPKPPVKS
jgi:hypothetical protein